MQHRPRKVLVLLVTLALFAAACGDDDGATVRDLDEPSEASASGSGSASASGSGSASASGPASGSASAPATGSDAPTAGDGGYEYASDVSAHRLVVADLCPIGDLLDAGDFAAVETIYRDGVNSVNADGSVRSIGGFAASEDRNHGMAEFYGQATPLDDFVTSALEGSGAFEGASDGERAQGVEKGMRNQVMIAWVVHELDSALDKAAAGELDPAEGAPHNWDEAWAFYHGSEPDCAPYATANSRAGNFATTGADGETARANEAILAAMIAGRDALLAGDTAAAEAAAADIERNVVVTYSQATIRYATVIEDDLAAGDADQAAVHQAEGLSFWRVIEAMVVPQGADGDAIAAMFDLASEPGANGFGDEARQALEPAWEALGITADDIGTLQ